MFGMVWIYRPAFCWNFEAGLTNAQALIALNGSDLHTADNHTCHTHTNAHYKGPPGARIKSNISKRFTQFSLLMSDARILNMIHDTKLHACVSV